ncbi:lipase family alpha/beta hydrolase [Dactylosporangium darangshiense]|uniref:lipase family alpha/beta hydrolase n=1 Tax=Dactylosporangium darangshiense TaxID=579108 RepID=UPI00362AA610
MVLVAHSMGGLVARWFTEQLHGDGETRYTVTLGTPFYGSAKAAVILSTGRGGPLPLPRARLRRLVAGMPGLYALLPAYRCVEEGPAARPLTADDVARLGGDADLAKAAMAMQAVLRADGGRGLRPLVGVEQPTVQSIVLADGVAEGREYTLLPGDDGPPRRVDRGGDGTVYRDAAAPVGAEPVYLPQTHTAIAKTREAVAHVRSVLTENPLGPPLGETAIGLTLPDVVTAGAPFEIGITGTDPAVVTCRVLDVGSERQVDRPAAGRRDGRLSATVTLPEPGVYRVELDGGGASPVSDLVMAVPADDRDEPASRAHR